MIKRHWSKFISKKDTNKILTTITMKRKNDSDSLLMIKTCLKTFQFNNWKSSNSVKWWTWIRTSSLGNTFWILLLKIWMNNNSTCQSSWPIKKVDLSVRILNKPFKSTCKTTLSIWSAPSSIGPTETTYSSALICRSYSTSIKGITTLK